MIFKVLIVSALSQIPRFVAALGMFAAFGIVEMILPAERGHSIQGRVRNIAYTAVLLFGGAVITALLMFVIPWKPAHLPDKGVLHSLQILFLYLIFTDILFYWYHRAQHSLRFLWPIHELHHADVELNVTTSMRSYWLELPIQALLITQPAFFLFGVDARAAVIFPLVSVFWLLMTHANLRLPFGRYTPIVCGPQLHRIHHSKLPEHRNRNFAQFFPLIDVIFGTYYRPHADEFPPTGVESLPSDAPIGEVLAKPFRYWLRR